MSGLLAIGAAFLAFMVPLAVPLFAQRWRSFLAIGALGAAFFGWLNFDIVAAAQSGGTGVIGAGLGGLMLFGFAAGAIAKFVMLVSRPKD